MIIITLLNWYERFKLGQFHVSPYGHIISSDSLLGINFIEICLNLSPFNQETVRLVLFSGAAPLACFFNRFSSEQWMNTRNKSPPSSKIIFHLIQLTLPHQIKRKTRESRNHFVSFSFVFLDRWKVFLPSIPSELHHPARIIWRISNGNFQLLTLA